LLSFWGRLFAGVWVELLANLICLLLFFILLAEDLAPTEGLARSLRKRVAVYVLSRSRESFVRCYSRVIIKHARPCLRLYRCICCHPNLLKVGCSLARHQNLQLVLSLVSNIFGRELVYRLAEAGRVLI